VAPDDLWSSGAMGLLDAARRYDPGRDVRFESFAERRVRGAMLDEMRRMDHLPRRLRAQVERVERARLRLAQQLARDADVAEIGEAVGLATDEVCALLSLGQPHARTLDDLVCALPEVDDQVARAETARALAAAVERLPARLQLVLALHYDEGLTYREMAPMLEVSEPRICQLHGEALSLLRRAMAGRETGAPIPPAPAVARGAAPSP
jgi:RNA polymerase sigma factor for flagellar operon FliA